MYSSRPAWQITGGCYDPASRTLTFTYTQDWNQARGEARLALSADGLTLSGTWSQVATAGAPRGGSWTARRSSPSELLGFTTPCPQLIEPATAPPAAEPAAAPPAAEQFVDPETIQIVGIVELHEFGVRLNDCITAAGGIGLALAEPESVSSSSFSPDSSDDDALNLSLACVAYARGLEAGDIDNAAGAFASALQREGLPDDLVGSAKIEFQRCLVGGLLSPTTLGLGASVNLETAVRLCTELVLSTSGG